MTEYEQKVGHVYQQGFFYWFDSHTAYFGFSDQNIWEKVIF